MQNVNLGNVISGLRKEKGMRQKTLASKCNITVSYLSQIENNRKEPAIQLLKKLGEELNISHKVMIFLTLDENDVPESKREYYRLFSPTMKEIMKETFSLNDMVQE